MKKNITDYKEILRNASKTRILIAPLDWGLGHTTRIVPLVKQLITAGCRVYLAGNTQQQQILAAEFPQLPFLPLNGYNVRYSRWGFLFPLLLAKQLPLIRRRIKEEHEWLSEKMEEYQFSMVISDNRYGLYHDQPYCIFITHQLRVQSGWGKWVNNMLQRLHYRFINCFDECWIPDQQHNDLAGELSHPVQLPVIPVRYIGWLSRLQKPTTTVKKNYVLVVLSGPEPQRSLFEKIIMEQVSEIEQPIILVRGVPGAKDKFDLPPHVTIHHHVPAAHMQELMSAASLVICRSGYSTLMDLACLQQQAVLVPTPGQTEQLYLARYLAKKQWAPYFLQSSFSLKKAITHAREYDYKSFPEQESLDLFPVPSTIPATPAT